MSTAASENAPLTKLNYANLAAYGLNVLVTYGIGVAGLFGFPSNSELSEKYQTLVTPIGWAFSIWGPIFIFQGIWTIAQMFPSYRAHPMVTEGVSYWYFAVCAAQACWTLAFATETNWLACIFMYTILGCLLKILYNQYQLEKPSNKDYWLLAFPFEIHSGWIVAASAVNLSVLFVAYGSDNEACQLSVAILSLSAIVCVALSMLFYLKKPLITPACVCGAWAFGGIAAQLKDPIEGTLENFPAIVLDGVRGATATASIIFAVLTGLFVIKEIYNQLTAMTDKRSASDEAFAMRLSKPLTGTADSV